MAGKYEDLVKGQRQGYAANLTDLLKFANSKTNKIDLYAAVTGLKTKIKEIIKEIESESGKEIEMFKIGKTHAHLRAKKSFDPMNMKTWKIGSSVGTYWNTKCKDEKYDGLIVLCGITEDMLDSCIPHPYNKEDFAVALKQQLMHSFVYEDLDPRICEPFGSGGKAHNPHAGVVFFAYKFESDAEE